MNWIFESDRPIYIQIIEQLKRYIVSGIYKPGERLPAVRELALETKVNPNTMQKALSELENSKIVYTQRTSGRYVTEDKELLKKLKKDLAKDKLNEFVSYMNELGFNNNEIIDYLIENRKGE